MATEARRRLLFLLPFPPHARGRHGGSRAIAELLGRIAPHHAVAVLYLRDVNEAPIDPDLAAICEQVHAVPRPPARRGTIVQRLIRRARFVAALLRGTPIWAQVVAVPEFATSAERLARDWQPDLVELDYQVMGRYLGALDACSSPRLLVVYEPGEDGAGRAWEDPSDLLRRLDRRAWSIFERRVLQRVQCVVTLTEADRTSIERRGVDVPVETIGLGVRIPESAADPLGYAPPTVLFVGNYRHVPNRDAAFRLALNIWPLVRSRHPDAVLSLVGDNPPRELVALERAGIEVPGAVPQIEPYLDRAALCVAPLREGGGMRVKVLEALAAGKAVVASPLATAGLDVEHERQVLLATDDDEFAEAICRLLDDPPLRISLAAAARKWAVENVGIERTAAAFEALYERLIREGS
jgi:glycosyltransferase involved in cell wall biosynthesis